MYKLCTESSICTHHLFDEIFINYLLMHYKLTSSTMQHMAKYMPHIRQIQYFLLHCAFIYTQNVSTEDIGQNTHLLTEVLPPIWCRPRLAVPSLVLCELFRYIWLSSRQNLSSNTRFDARLDAVAPDRFLLDLTDIVASAL